MRDPDSCDCRSLILRVRKVAPQTWACRKCVLCLERSLGEAYRPGASLHAWQGGGWAVSWGLILEIGENLQKMTSDHHSRESIVASDLCSWSFVPLELGGERGIVIG
jgi:hypothetical protein